MSQVLEYNKPPGLLVMCHSLLCFEDWFDDIRITVDVVEYVIFFFFFFFFLFFFFQAEDGIRDSDM